VAFAAHDFGCEQVCCQLDGAAPPSWLRLAFALHFLEMVSTARIPLATYRLQFNRGFTFRDARSIADYLHALGISDCYASSYLRSVPGSPHGYDVADPTRLNPDIGDEEDYWAWIEALRSHSMGHVLDVVPNHMGIALSANPWWLDVLENGPSSRYARFFDIEWRPVKAELADKVLIPILGDQYGAVLDRQELRLMYREGAFFVQYYDNLLPIAPDTYGGILADALGDWVEAHPGDDADELQIILAASGNLPPRSSRDPGPIAVRAREKDVIKRRLGTLTESSSAVRALIDACVDRVNGIPGQPRSFDLLDALLNQQSYRLAHWRVASEEINYRRFFDVNQLAALRMEDPAVFDEVHRFLFELVRRGGPTGVRIDHVDGLYTPGDYLRRLQASLQRAAATSSTADRASTTVVNDRSSSKDFYIVVEKILGADEHLPADWPIHGTTGYEFASVVNNLFVDRRNEQALDEIYVRFVRERRERLSFADLAYRSKKRVMHETMSGDINSLGHQLNRFSETNRHFRDFTLYNLISTLKEVIACFPVYRTYVTGGEPVTEHDRRYIVEAVGGAKRRASGVTPLVFDFIQRLLLLETPVDSSDQMEERARFTGKFQQITSPVAAKGIEDTACYVYNRLLSLNEVGSDPTRFGLEPASVHSWFADRRRSWPTALSATSTHDTKRGEDVRARLNVLSEIPGAWKSAVGKWRRRSRRLKSEVHGALAPDANEEYLLYQTLVGMWPFNADLDEAIAQVRERACAYVTKALREAKVHTSWLNPDDEYEQAVLRFVERLLDRRHASRFLDGFLPFQARVAQLGIYNSLAQLVIKLTAPGVPDFYQGTELWDLHLVDPDNRHPVDYEQRRTVLAGLKTCQTPAGDCAADLLRRRADGRVKMFVTNRGLAARAEWRDVFENGDYLPLQTAGLHQHSVFAFARRHGESATITAVPRLIASVLGNGTDPPLGRSVWGDTHIALPDPLDTSFPRSFVNVFTGATIVVDGATIPAATLFDRFPVALLVPSRGESPTDPSSAIRDPQSAIGNRPQDAHRRT
jgi:(1->4)-alpha-D-glucan 1-alpha-D-glucosylmutase